MLNITSACLEALKADAVQSIQIHVAPLRGGEFDITENDIAQGGFTYNNDLINGDTLQIGAMTAAEVKITLENADGRFNDVWFAGAILTIKLRILLVNGQYEVLPFGVYTVNEQPRSTTMISLTAYDNLMRLDVQFDPSVFALERVSERTIVMEGISVCGLQCNDYSMFDNVSDVEVAKINSESTITWRQVIMWCCQLNCVNGIADENGYICFKFYEKYVPMPLQTEAEESLETEYGDLLLADEIAENDFPITAAERYMDGSTFDEEDCVITGHQFKDGDALYPADANMEYGIQTENNLVWSASAQKEEKAAALNEEIAGFTYFPYQCNITPFPHLQLMDSIDYVRNGTHHHSIITNLQFTLNGGMTIAAKAKSKVQKGWASVGALTPGQQAIIDSISHKITNTQADLDAREQYLLQFNEAIAGSMGFYTTYKEEEDGSRISYMHDKPTLEESQTIYTFGTNGFAWTNDGWNDGNPVWEYGFDRNGNAILNAIYAYTLTADVITSGILRSQNGASSINLNDGTFSFGYVDKWLDIDTGETEEDYHTVLSLEDKVLNIYGVLRGIKYPNVSIAIGQSANGDVGSFSVTDSNIGDLFTVETSVDGSTVRLGFPIFEQTRYASRGLTASEDGLTLYYSQNGGDGASVYCGADGAGIQSNNAFFRAYRDQFNFSTLSGHTHCWFNFYAPDTGNAPTAYDFGNGAGDHADILCAGVECESISCSSDDVGDLIARFNGRITVGGNTSWENTALNVTGDTYIVGGCYANNFYNNSSRDFKTNIQPQNMQALPLIKNMAFYSYDYKTAIRNKDAGEETSESNAHVNIGLIANEAPSVILSKNQDAVDLYEYISLTAKAVQELAKKIEEQAQKISALEAEIAELKK